MECELCDFKKCSDYRIIEDPYWIATPTYDDRSHLGRAYVTLKSDCGNLSDLKEEEWNDLRMVISRYKQAYRSAFGTCLFNRSCFMNDAFRPQHPSPHTHFHVRQRCSTCLCFSGVSFDYKEFGSDCARERKSPDDQTVKVTIRGIRINDKG
jgi:diadenosine tetraphosphate (Ap4A) HIT family hydrolase